MSGNMKNDEKKMIAMERRGFYIHFIIYILVNILITVQWWYITGGKGFPWVITTTLGWGIGIIAHFLAVFIFLNKC
jgi:hypothetical protein